ncbi:hypothetical protein ABEB36_012196 [Hypothenemus hampei]|uniref:RWD domain-containing protein n=1 Tax=Hypothenemus hampei TaxID=57062 RepID=A0ABD1EB64_HYPHA
MDVLQDEEREVLLSIYEGDENFKQIAPNTFQYKYGVCDSIKSFVLEIKWNSDYPNELPEINLDLFYNKHLVQSVKQIIQDLIKTEAEQYRGMSMTFSLFEFVKEKFHDLIKEQPEKPVELDINKLCIAEDQDSLQETRKEKKEQLTKAQKRRQWNKLDGKGEKPRGWNWIDIVKHLSQTGCKEDSKNPIT